MNDKQQCKSLLLPPLLFQLFRREIRLKINEHKCKTKFNESIYY